MNKKNLIKKVNEFLETLETSDNIDNDIEIKKNMGEDFISNSFTASNTIIIDEEIEEAKEEIEEEKNE